MASTGETTRARGEAGEPVRERVLQYDVIVLDSGAHGLDGRSARLEVHYGPAAVHAVLTPERGPRLTWRVGHTARGEDILVVSGPNTSWRFRIVAAHGAVAS